MNYDVVVEPRARRDIHLAAHWILAQSESPATAVRWASKLRATIATLKANPQRCPVDPDSDVYGEEVRVLLHGKRRGVYRVLFAIRRNTVHVLTVRHSANGHLPTTWRRMNRLREENRCTNRNLARPGSPDLQQNPCKLWEARTDALAGVRRLLVGALGWRRRIGRGGGRLSFSRRACQVSTVVPRRLRIPVSSAEITVLPSRKSRPV